MAADDAERRGADVHRVRRLSRSRDVNREEADRRSARLRLTRQAFGGEGEGFGVPEARRTLFDGAGTPPRAMAPNDLADDLRRTSSRVAAWRQVTGFQRAIEVLVKTCDPAEVSDGRELGGRQEPPQQPAGRVARRPDGHGIADRAQGRRDLVGDRAMSDEHDEGEADGEPEDEDDRHRPRGVAEGVANTSSDGRHVACSLPLRLSCSRRHLYRLGGFGKVSPPP